MIVEVVRENLRSAIGYDHLTPEASDCDALDGAEEELRRMKAEGLQSPQFLEVPSER